MNNLNDYNIILKNICKLNSDIEYNEIITETVYAITLSKQGIILYSQFCTENFSRDWKNQLSVLLIKNILRVGINRVEKSNISLEEFKEQMNNLNKINLYGK